MRRVRIKWLDACSRHTEGRWSDIDDVKALSPLQCESMGWIVVDAETYLTIASHIGESNAGGEICIPKNYIIEIMDQIDA